MISRTSRRWAPWLAGGALVAVAAVLGGTFSYIHFISGPAPAQLSLKAQATGSVIGYRVEFLMKFEGLIAPG